jgi:3-hydroxyisobutyrate dehydrogenase-like beta-hydroxyacid dehydrogenase
MSAVGGARPDAAAERIALIGYGEVGQTLAADLAAHGVRDLVAWDRLFAHEASAPSRSAAACGRVRVAAGMRDALAGRTLAICAVTAGECLAAAEEAAQHLPRDAYFLDLNSVSPGTKTAAGAVIEAAGGRYVEAAVMSPIAPRRCAAPMLLGGANAEEFAVRAQALGFTGVQAFDRRLGRASAAKMCRSVMVKGLEALLCESLLAARRLGVEETVLESLRDLLPAENWPRLAAYMIGRSLLHGRRRAEEMREAARTVSEAGLAPWMSAACAKRQDFAADLGLAPHDDSLAGLLDAMLRRMPAAPETTA